jgi:hypothetical protein
MDPNVYTQNAKPNPTNNKPKINSDFSGITTLPPQKNSVPGIPLGEEVRNFRLNILYDNVVIP